MSTTHRSLTLPILPCKVKLRWEIYHMKKWNHCKSSYCAYTLEYVVIFAHVEQLAYRLSPPRFFVNFWALVFSRRRPAVITGPGRVTDRKSRFKNTSTQNFEVLTWILTYICTLILWIICLNATSQLFNGFRFIALWVPWILRNRPISGGYALTKRALNLWPLS